MIAMWDDLFCKADPKIAELLQRLNANGSEESVRQIYTAMHDYLAKVWAETYRVLVDGGIACINIGDATRTINGKFQLYPNHSRITEVCEKIGFTTLPYILWKKPTTKPMYKGKGAFLGFRFPSAKRLRHVGLRVYSAVSEGETASFRQKTPCVTRAS